nr:receptor like protein 30 [Quercus suber]
MIMVIRGSKLIQILVFYLIGLHCMEMALTGAVPCMDSEQDALLKIKEGFKDVSEPFSSWTAEEDCCNWRGVGCDNTTGHVTMLDLHSRDPTSKLPGEQWIEWILSTKSCPVFATGCPGCG